MSDLDTKHWIYAGGLAFELTEGDVICVFSQYGEIDQFILARDKDTGKSRGYGFVKYEDSRSCELAVDNLNGITVVGRRIKVSFANNINAIKAIRPTSVRPTEDTPLPIVESVKREADRGRNRQISPDDIKRRDYSPIARKSHDRHRDQDSKIDKRRDQDRDRQPDRGRDRDDYRDRRNPSHRDESSPSRRYGRDRDEDRERRNRRDRHSSSSPMQRKHHYDSSYKSHRHRDRNSRRHSSDSDDDLKNRKQSSRSHRSRSRSTENLRSRRRHEDDRSHSRSMRR